MPELSVFIGSNFRLLKFVRIRTEATMINGMQIFSMLMTKTCIALIGILEKFLKSFIDGKVYEICV